MGKKNKKKNKGPRDQHFVPRCYLSEFTDPNTPPGQEPYVWVFDKDGKNPHKRAPKNVFTETHMQTSETPQVVLRLFYVHLSLNGRVAFRLERLRIASKATTKEDVVSAAIRYFALINGVTIPACDESHTPTLIRLGVETSGNVLPLKSKRKVTVVLASAGGGEWVQELQGKCPVQTPLQLVAQALETYEKKFFYS